MLGAEADFGPDLTRRGDGVADDWMGGGESVVVMGEYFESSLLSCPGGEKVDEWPADCVIGEYIDDWPVGDTPVVFPGCDGCEYTEDLLAGGINVVGLAQSETDLLLALFGGRVAVRILVGSNS